MRVIGITGGIGSGKSTVSNLLKGFGAKIIDADLIARDIVRKGERALMEIEAFFGAEVITADGELDRKSLGKIVFGNQGKLKVLNEITHKYIIEKIKNQLDFAGEEGVEVVAIDAAIPFKEGFIDMADEIWVVAADEKVRIERIMARNGLTYEEALSRVNSQMMQEEYIKLADRVIFNNSGIEELINKVKELFFS